MFLLFLFWFGSRAAISLLAPEEIHDQRRPTLSSHHNEVQDSRHYQGTCLEVTLLANGSQVVRFKICQECRTLISTDESLKPAPEACVVTAQVLAKVYDKSAQATLGSLVPKIPEQRECSSCMPPPPKINVTVRPVLPGVGPGWRRGMETNAKLNEDDYVLSYPQSRQGDKWIPYPSLDYAIERAFFHGKNVWYDRVGFNGKKGLEMKQWAVYSPQIYSERKVLAIIPAQQENVVTFGQKWARKLFSSKSFQFVSEMCKASAGVPKGLKDLVQSGISETPNIEVLTRAWLIQERAMAIRGRRLYLDDKSDRRLASAAALVIVATVLLKHDRNWNILAQKFNTTLGEVEKMLYDGWDFLSDFVGTRTLTGSRTLSDKIFTHYCMWNAVHGEECSMVDGERRPKPSERIIQSAIFWSAPIYDKRDRILMAIGMRGDQQAGLANTYPVSLLEDGFRIVGWWDLPHQVRENWDIPHDEVPGSSSTRINMLNPWISPVLAAEAIENAAEAIENLRKDQQDSSIIYEKLWGAKPIEASCAGWRVLRSFTLVTAPGAVFAIDNRISRLIVLCVLLIIVFILFFFNKLIALFTATGLLLLTPIMLLTPMLYWNWLRDEKNHQVLLCGRRVAGCSELALFRQEQDSIVHEIARVAVTRPMDKEMRQKLFTTPLGPLWWPRFNVEHPTVTWGELLAGLELHGPTFCGPVCNSSSISTRGTQDYFHLETTNDECHKIWDPFSKRLLKYVIVEEQHSAPGLEEQNDVPLAGEDLCLVV